MANPEKIAPATKYGGKIVECQPGRIADREVERHDRVHRDDQRRRQAGQEQVGRPVAMPVPRRAPPAHRQERRRCTAPSDSWPGPASVARSGISPTYQNKSDTVAYVETAKTSQISGLRHCGQSAIVLGYGSSQ